MRVYGNNVNTFGALYGLSYAESSVDPYYSNVSLLLHCEGANNSTIFTDNSPNPKTVSAVGNAKITTTAPLSQLGSLILDGTGDYLSIPLSSDFDFGTGDFTIECQARTTITTLQTIFTYGLISAVTTANEAMSLFVVGGAGGVFQFTLVSGSTGYTVSSTTVPQINTTYQIGIKRLSGTLSLWVNGVQEASISANVSINTPASRTFRIGRYVNSPTREFNGKIDEFRVTKGIARNLSIYPNQIFPNE